MKSQKVHPLDSQPDQEYPRSQTQEKEIAGLDPRLMAGPLSDRNCTDIFCCTLFCLNLIVMGYIGYTGYTSGQPDRLIAVYDSDKKACGLDVLGYPYLYFAIPWIGYFNRTTCVQYCPNYTAFIDKPQSLPCSVNSAVTTCNQNCLNFDNTTNFSLPLSPSLYTLSQFVCVYNTTIMFDRICYPQEILTQLQNGQQLASNIQLDQVTVWVQDLKTTSQVIYASFLLAFLLGILYLTLTRYLAGVIVWISILFFFLILMALTYLCYIRQMAYLSMSQDTTDQYSFQQRQKASDNAITFQYITYIMVGILGLAIIGFICIFNKLRLAVAVIKTAAIFVRDEFLIILVPPVSAIFTFGLWIWWIFTAIYVYSLGDIRGDGQTPFATVTLSLQVKHMVWYFVFGGLWTNALIQAINDFTIASSCCIWYFSQGTGQVSDGPIRNSIYRVFRFHLGSLAFGSLILAIVQMIRIVLEYTRYQMEQVGAGKNKVTKCILSCLSCVMACFDRFIRFLNRNAYIQIALTGKSFCPAAKQAFETIWANSMRYSLVDGIGGAFLFVGKAFISVTCVTIFYYVITTLPQYSSKLFSPVLPCIVVFIVAYSISVLFMQIYGMACDTVLTCFIYDEDLNKQNGGQSASHCPETLRDFFETPVLAQKTQEAQPKKD